MPQLLVRNVEPAIVRMLRDRAAAQGVSTEEAHRRVLRSVLLGEGSNPGKNFIEYLRSIPPGKAVEFPRPSDLPGKIAL